MIDPDMPRRLRAESLRITMANANIVHENKTTIPVMKHSRKYHPES